MYVRQTTVISYEYGGYERESSYFIFLIVSILNRVGERVAQTTMMLSSENTTLLQQQQQNVNLLLSFSQFSLFLLLLLLFSLQFCFLQYSSSLMSVCPGPFSSVYFISFLLFMTSRPAELWNVFKINARTRPTA